MYHLFPEDGRTFSPIFDNKRCGEFPDLPPSTNTKESGIYNTYEMIDESVIREPVASSKLEKDEPGFSKGGLAAFGPENNDNPRGLTERTENSKKRQDKRG